MSANQPQNMQYFRDDTTEKIRERKHNLHNASLQDNGGFHGKVVGY